MSLEQGSVTYPSLGLDDYYEGRISDGKANLVIKAQDFGAIVGGSAIFCLLGVMAYTEDDIKEALNVVTGKNYTIPHLLKIGQRSWYLKRILNHLCGLTKDDETLPPRLLQPLKSGAAADSVPDMELMLSQYYELRHLRPDGLPHPQLLRELGLSEAEELLFT